MTSFEESFWGDQDKGFEVLVGRMKQGKHICEEIVTLLKERASIEEEYSKKLGRLAKSFIVKEELGSLRDALEVLKSETEKSSRIHQDHAVDLRNKLEKPLQEFITSQTAIRKDVFWSYHSTKKSWKKTCLARLLKATWFCVQKTD
jgi:hypothetical protein